jgi:hypothetical protein
LGEQRPIDCGDRGAAAGSRVAKAHGDTRAKIDHGVWDVLEWLQTKNAAPVEGRK